MIEPEEFRNFEHAGWEQIPNQYHRAFGELTSQAIEALLDAARVRKGTKLLDVACGPGYVSALAVKRGAIVLGIDFREGDAAQLPSASGLFDAVAMNFGILHLGQPENALLEAYRVLRSGGRFAFSVWCDPQETIGFAIVLRAVQAHGEPRVTLPEGPPFFRYSHPEECTRGLTAAGFESAAVRKISQTWRLPAGDGLFYAMKDSTVRTAGLLRAQKPTVLDKIRAAMRAEVAKYTRGEVVELSMPALIVSGVKP